jgi:hypothetical protein
MDKNSRLLQIDERLKQIQSARSNTGQQVSVDGNDRLAQIDDRLSQINQLKSQSNSSKKGSFVSELSELAFSPLPELRGAAKTVGSAVDIGRDTFPTIDSNKKRTLEMAIKSLEGIPGREEELQSLQQELININAAPQQSKREQFSEYVDNFSGKGGEPVGTVNQFREKVGEFAPGPLSGTKVAPAIAAVSQGLRELGLDESYSDLIAAVGAPNLSALAKLPGKLLKKLGDYAATIGSKEYRRGANIDKAAKFLQEKVGESNIPDVVNKIENYETPFNGNINEGEAAYRPLTADVADNVGLSQYHRAKAENIPAVGEKRLRNEEILKQQIDKLASKEATPQASQEFAAGERAAYQSDLGSRESAARQRANEAAERFEGMAKADDSGRATQEYLDDRVSSIKKDAQAKARPLYDEANQWL